MIPEATIVIPTHDHGPTLRASVASALRQTRPVEVFVVGDGVPDETREIVGAMAASDGRVRFFDHPKGPRHGEIYRHQALQHARGRIVCYLSDDDLYLPHHVEEMHRLLETADFAHAFALCVEEGGGLSSWTVNLELPAFRLELLEGRNRIPLSAGAHTLEAYRRLAGGWTSAPESLPTDLHMWQKFLRDPECRFRAAGIPTVLIFRSPPRREWTSAGRLAELERWLEMTGNPRAIAELCARCLADKTAEASKLEARILDSYHNGGILPGAESVLQVFFPHPDGYSERNSTRVPLQFREWRNVTVQVPCAQAERVRIDPAGCPCLIEISRIQLLDTAGRELWRMTESNAHTIEVAGTALPVSRGHILRLLSDGDDPQIVLPPVPTPAETAHLQLEVRIRLIGDVQSMSRAFSEYLRSLA